MGRAWKTIRVFISSTFRDMHSERDHLVRVVFPELRERCAKRHLHLIDVDLRWGVTEEEAELGQVLEICLDEIERCRPFFVGILGERYGSVLANPRPKDPRYDWLQDLDQRYSVTALEIYHGVLRNSNLQTRSFFYFRDPAFISDLPSEFRPIFLAESEDAAHKLASLKDEIRGCCPVFENYPCSYSGQSDGVAMITALEEFGQRVLDDLWSAISEEYPEEESQREELEIERAFHEAFIESRVQRFIGRADLLRRVSDYAQGETEAAPLVLIGAPGSGKSALLAKFAYDYAQDHPDTFVLSHFIGASPGSTDIRRTLARLCGELDQHFALGARIPEDFQELWQQFIKLLERAGTSGELLLLIDAVNQLDDRHDPQALHWLPATLPARVRIIVSTLEGDFLNALRRRSPTPPEITVGALSEDERRALVREMLWDYRKRLDERAENDQMGRLLSKQDADNPLYLVVACEELRLFGEFERVTARIDLLPGTAEQLLEQVLERLEIDLSVELVRDALSLLECSRQGLLEIEMLELLRRRDEEQLPRAIWAGLYRGLRFYLRPTGEAGEGVLDFFHRQLAKAVRKRYLTTQAQSLVHERLAQFFRSRIDPLRDGRWNRDYPRGLSELPHHLLHAGRYGELFALARDRSFSDSVASAFSTDPRLMLEVLQKSIEAAARLDDSSLIAEFVLAHARRHGDVAAESPLEALRRGEIERAWELADMQPADRCLLWHLILAWELKETGKLDQARATLQRLVQRDLPRLRRSYWASRCALPLLAKIAAVSNELLHTIRRCLLESSDFEQLCNELAMEGEVSAAREIADELPQPYQREHSHRDIAVGQIARVRRFAVARDFDKATEVVNQIAHTWSQLTALSEIALAQAEAGLLDAASETIERVRTITADNSPIPAEPLRDIAVAQAKAGYLDSARATLRAALDSALSMESGYNREESLAGLVPRLIEFGDFEMALEAARALPSWIGGPFFSSIVEAQANRGDLSGALLTAQLCGRPEDRMAALNSIGIAQGRAGAREAALATLSEAVAVALETRSILDGANGLRDVALAQTLAGLEDEARVTFERAIETIRGKADRAQLGHLATTLTRAGNLDRAIEIAGEIDHEEDHIRALAAVASERAKSGDRETAIRILGELADRTDSVLVLPGARTGAFGAIARVYVEDLQDFASAVAVVGRAKESAWMAAEDIVYGVFGHPASFKIVDNKRVEDPQQARWILASMLNSMHRGEATDNEARAIGLNKLVEAQASAGQIETAFRVARLTPEGFYRDSGRQMCGCVRSRRAI